MAYYNKIGLLVLNEAGNKFLVVEPDKFLGQDHAFLLPGGQVEKGESDEVCLEREIKEELNCGIKSGSLKFIAEYEALAAGHTDGRTVHIKLYQGELEGEPVPSSEIVNMYWVGKDYVDHPKLSIITNLILKDIISSRIIN